MPQGSPLAAWLFTAALAFTLDGSLHQQLADSVAPAAPQLPCGNLQYMDDINLWGSTEKVSESGIYYLLALLKPGCDSSL